MKTGLILVIAVVVGVAVGMSAAVLRVRAAPWKDRLIHLEKNVSAGHPKVVVDEDEYHFGEQDVESPGEHRFRLHNKGNAPLRLTKGSTTCSCMLSDLDRTEIAPGESATVVLQWQSKGREGEYQQTGTVLTNDPDRPRVKLAVSGQFVSDLHANPTEVQFSSLSQNESALASVQIKRRQSQPWQITGYELSDTSLAKFFAITFTPLTADKSAADGLKSEGSAQPAQNGFQMQIKVKSGLPLGAFQQTITVKTNIEKRPVIEIPVAGRIVGDISIVGPRRTAGPQQWNAEKELLSIDSISSQEGIRWRLTIYTRGPHRKEVKFKPVRVTPDLLRVEVGETTPINDGVVLQTPLFIEIPKGSPAANYLGTAQSPVGEITIETGHPTIPRLKIHVAFAIF